ncbi:MAG: hypothetical protein ACLVJ6_16950 [Merdibacter sp.]
MIDGHVHLENGDLSVDYAMQFVDAAVKKGIRTLQILDHTHRFLEFAPMYAGVRLPRCRLMAEEKTKDHLSTYHHLIETMKQMDLPIEVRSGLESATRPAEPFCGTSSANILMIFLSEASIPLTGSYMICHSHANCCGIVTL